LLGFAGDLGYACMVYCVGLAWVCTIMLLVAVSGLGAVLAFGVVSALGVAGASRVGSMVCVVYSAWLAGSVTHGLNTMAVTNSTPPNATPTVNQNLFSLFALGLRSKPAGRFFGLRVGAFLAGKIKLFYSNWFLWWVIGRGVGIICVILASALISFSTMSLASSLGSISTSWIDALFVGDAFVLAGSWVA
jgi:hypothetical protein